MGGGELGWRGGGGEGSEDKRFRHGSLCVALAPRISFEFHFRDEPLFLCDLILWMRCELVSWAMA